MSIQTVRARLALGLALALALVLSVHPAALETSGVAEPVAYPSTQQVLLNGAQVELQAYALKDANGFLTNYVKIRDMALALDHTTARFDVTWDGAVNISPGRPYLSPNGQENQCPYSGPQRYVSAPDSTLVDGRSAGIDAFVITDRDEGGSTYYKLRDLARVLDFYITWDSDLGILMDTSIPYSAPPR